MPGLQLAVREVGGQLQGSLEVFLRGLAQGLAVQLHADAHDVLLAHADQVLNLGDLQVGGGCYLDTG